MVDRGPAIDSFIYYCNNYYVIDCYTTYVNCNVIYQVREDGRIVFVAMIDRRRHDYKRI